MVDFAALAAFIPASLVIILSPGADTFLLLRFTIRGGTRAGLASMVGILLGLSTMSLVLISGVGLVLTRVPLALDVLTFGGIAILLFLALTSVRQALALLRAHATVASPPGAIVEARAQVAAARSHPLRLSFITNVTNPKVLIFYLAFFPQFLGTAESPVWQLALLSAAFLVTTVVWLVPLVYAASAATVFFSRRPVAIAMEFSVAAVFLVLAVVLVVTL